MDERLERHQSCLIIFGRACDKADLIGYIHYRLPDIAARAR
jgi:hypothetical protein